MPWNLFNQFTVQGNWVGLKQKIDDVLCGINDSHPVLKVDFMYFNFSFYCVGYYQGVFNFKISCFSKPGLEEYDLVFSQYGRRGIVTSLLISDVVKALGLAPLAPHNPWHDDLNYDYEVSDEEIEHALDVLKSEWFDRIEESLIRLQTYLTLGVSWTKIPANRIVECIRTNQDRDIKYLGLDVLRRLVVQNGSPFDASTLSLLFELLEMKSRDHWPSHWEILYQSLVIIKFLLIKRPDLFEGQDLDARVMNLTKSECKRVAKVACSCVTYHTQEYSAVSDLTMVANGETKHQTPHMQRQASFVGKYYPNSSACPPKRRDKDGHIVDVVAPGRLKALCRLEESGSVDNPTWKTEGVAGGIPWMIDFIWASLSDEERNDIMLRINDYCPVHLVTWLHIQLLNNWSDCFTPESKKKNLHWMLVPRKLRDDSHSTQQCSFVASDQMTAAMAAISAAEDTSVPKANWCEFYSGSYACPPKLPDQDSYVVAPEWLQDMCYLVESHDGNVETWKALGIPAGKRWMVDWAWASLRPEERGFIQSVNLRKLGELEPYFEYWLLVQLDYNWPECFTEESKQDVRVLWDRTMKWVNTNFPNEMPTFQLMLTPRKINIY